MVLLLLSKTKGNLVVHFLSDHSPGSYKLPFGEVVDSDATLSVMVEVVALKQCRPQFPCTSHEVSFDHRM